jgi:hypothetical protein
VRSLLSHALRDGPVVNIVECTYKHAHATRPVFGSPAMFHHSTVKMIRIPKPMLI